MKIFTRKTVFGNIRYMFPALVSAIGFLLLGVLPAFANGYTIERAGTSKGSSGYGLNLYSQGGRVNAWNVTQADDLTRWVRESYGLSTRLLSGQNNGYCLTAGGLYNNAPIYSKPCGSSPNQNWTLDDIDGAWSWKRLRIGNYCANLPNVNLWNGGYVFMYQCNSQLLGDIEQVWRF